MSKSVLFRALLLAGLCVASAEAQAVGFKFQWTLDLDGGLRDVELTSKYAVASTTLGIVVSNLETQEQRILDLPADDHYTEVRRRAAVTSDGKWVVVVPAEPKEATFEPVVYDLETGGVVRKLEKRYLEEAWGPVHYVGVSNDKYVRVYFKDRACLWHVNGGFDGCMNALPPSSASLAGNIAFDRATGTAAFIGNRSDSLGYCHQRVAYWPAAEAAAAVSLAFDAGLACENARSAVEFIDGGKTIATLNQDGDIFGSEYVVRFWDATNGREIASRWPEENRYRVPFNWHSVAMRATPDGQYLAIGMNALKSVVFLSLADGKKVGEVAVDKGLYEFIRFSPDGNWMAVQESIDSYHIFRKED